MIDDDEHAVLADALIQRGDPLGELIAVQRALESVPASAPPARKNVLASRHAKLLDDHHDYLFGDLAPHFSPRSRPDVADPALVVGRWSGGFVEVVIKRRNIDLDLPAIVRGLKAAPIARIVRRLEIQHGDQVGAARELAAGAPLPALRDLVITWQKPHTDPLLEMLQPIVPQLETLSVRPTRYTHFKSARLKTLQLCEDQDQFWTTTMRFDAQLDAIEDLHLRHFFIDRDFFARYPTLRRADLSSTFEPDALAHFLTSNLRLESLELYSATFHDTDLDTLVRHADGAARIGQLTISIPQRNISTATREAARARLPQNIKLN